MTDRLEELVRQAQDVRAARAPDPDRVRLALPALAARRARRRRTGLAAGAGIAALALVAGILVAPDLLGGPANGIPGNRTTGTATPSTTASAAPTVTLGYAPDWVPPGYHERSRGAVLTAAGVKSVRTWAKGTVGTNGGVRDTVPYIQVVTQPDAELPEGVPVVSDGVSGTYSAPAGTPPTARLGWPAAPGHAVWIMSNSTTAEADLLHIATSLRLDTTAFPQTLEVGWGRDGNPEYSYSLSGDSPTDWNATVWVHPGGGSGSLSVSLAPTTDVPGGGKTVSVGGRPATLLVEENPPESNPRQCIVQRQPDGRYLLTVCYYFGGGAQLSEQELIWAAESVGTTIRFQTAWLG